jgi:hypothetical protein
MDKLQCDELQKVGQYCDLCEWLSTLESMLVVHGVWGAKRMPLVQQAKRIIASSSFDLASHPHPFCLQAYHTTIIVMTS